MSIEVPRPPLKGKKALVVGVANENSIAYGCAKAFRELEAELAITYLNEKAKTYVQPIADELQAKIFLPLDVAKPGELEAVFERIAQDWGRLDILVHSIAWAPKEDLQGGLLDCTAEGFARAMDISCHSFIRMAKLAAPLMIDGGSMFAMSYLGANRVVPNYNVMGPIKAALEAACRYLAYELGPRKIRVHPTGGVSVYTGSHSHGQGHETTFAQLVADELQIPIEQVEVIHGDTGAIPFGMGTYGSRSASVGGTALLMSANKIKEKGKRIAAHLLEASAKDIDYVNGQFQVRGAPGKAVPFGAVALTAYVPHNYPEGLEPGLEETSFYDPANFCFPFGAHACVVEVAPETGEVKILRYLAVDDVGNVINPMIVDGMVHGGIAQGVGQALWEGAVYSDDGQLLTGSMLDYALPKASRLPSFELDQTVTPSPVNPLGVKGVGEAGAIASTAAVANAVIDALSDLGIRHLDMPYTAQKVWAAMESAKGGQA